MATVTVDPIASPRIVTVDSPDVEISIQELNDLLRAWETAPENVVYDPLIDAAGKEDLGGGTFVGITLTLQNTLLAFAARPGPSTVQCTVSGGNLVAVDDLGATVSPIDPTAFTQVVIAQSSSATLLDAGGGIAASVWEAVGAAYTTPGSFGEAVNTILAKTALLPGAVPRGEALTLPFPMATKTGAPVLGIVPVVQVMQDGGGFAASTNAAVEVALGVYVITLTAAEMNAAAVTLYITGTGAVDRPITMLTSRAA
jgi:hypothetical protein